MTPTWHKFEGSQIYKFEGSQIHVTLTFLTPALPDDLATVWPKRRVLLWEYCAQRPDRFAQEFAMVAASELARRAFEPQLGQ